MSDFTALDWTWTLAFLLYLGVYWPILTGPEATPSG